MPQAGTAFPAAARAHAHPGLSRVWASALAAGCLLLAGPLVVAQATAAAAARAKAPATVAKTAKPGTKAKPASSRQKLVNQAKGLALASATTESINDKQLEIAARVLTGAADCEFKQTVQVLALPGKPGLFTVEHQGKRFVMAPRETSTGAVRLEDAAAGVMWLQIPAKSMLMNARIGQRMVDSCQHSEQRAATLAVADAAQSLGIEVRVSMAVPAPAAATELLSTPPLASPATAAPDTLAAATAASASASSACAASASTPAPAASAAASAVAAPAATVAFAPSPASAASAPAPTAASAAPAALPASAPASDAAAPAAPAAPAASR